MALGAGSARAGVNLIVRVTRTLAHRALVAQWIERSPAKAEVVGSNPAKRATEFGGGGAVACVRLHMWAVSSVG